MTSRIVGLIPARAGSKRVPNKNVLRLHGHPLLAYTISAALDSGVFEKVIVSTDSDEYAQIALHYGAEVPFLRPNSLAQDSSADIGWVAHALESLALIGYEYEIFQYSDLQVHLGTLPLFGVPTKNLVRELISIQ